MVKTQKKMHQHRVSNLAFIDGQNLHLGTMENKWKIDHYKFRVYLRDKYHIDEAHYFLDTPRKTNTTYTRTYRKPGS
jgi:hypothetical protein